MSTALKLASTDSGMIDYPISASANLEGHYFFTFRYRKWMNSDFRLADRDVRSVCFDLICLSQEQVPVGTLPTNEGLICILLGMSLDTWQGLCGRAIPPLHDWRRCKCDNGEIRLYHPLTMEMAVEAFGSREAHMEKAAADRERKRLISLPEQMARAGASRQMTEDQLYVIRLDQFILEHFPHIKQRRPNVVREAMEKMELLARAGGRG